MNNYNKKLQILKQSFQSTFQFQNIFKQNTTFQLWLYCKHMTQKWCYQYQGAHIPWTKKFPDISLTFPDQWLESEQDSGIISSLKSY